jgi:hypothetical protein
MSFVSIKPLHFCVAKTCAGLSEWRGWRVHELKMLRNISKALAVWLESKHLVLILQQEIEFWFQTPTLNNVSWHFQESVEASFGLDFWLLL